MAYIRRRNPFAVTAQPPPPPFLRRFAFGRRLLGLLSTDEVFAFSKAFSGSMPVLPLGGLLGGPQRSRKRKFEQGRVIRDEVVVLADGAQIACSVRGALKMKELRWLLR